MRFLCKFLPRIKLFGNVYYYYNYYHFWLSYIHMYREWCCRSEADDAFGCHGHGQKIFTQSSTSSRNFNFSLQKHNSILIDIQAGSICKDIGRKCMYFKWTFYTFVCITERYVWQPWQFLSALKTTDSNLYEVVLTLCKADIYQSYLDTCSTNLLFNISS